MSPESAVALLEANHFQIGGPITIDYSRTSFTGEPTLSYQAGDVGPLEFSGEEITAVTAPEGTFVSVILDSEPENFRRTFTFLIPTVHPERREPIEFTTFGFVTVIRDSLGGPSQVRGVVQNYWQYDLSGVADIVDF